MHMYMHIRILMPYLCKRVIMQACKEASKIGPVSVAQCLAAAQQRNGSTKTRSRSAAHAGNAYILASQPPLRLAHLRCTYRNCIISHASRATQLRRCVGTHFKISKLPTRSMLHGGMSYMVTCYRVRVFDTGSWVHGWLYMVTWSCMVTWSYMVTC